MRDTQHLSLAEHGAYSLLLDTYYATEKPLPAEHDALYRICRAMSRTEQAAVSKVAEEFFPISSDGLRHNKRADEEIKEAQAKIKAAQENGKRGGRRKNPTTNQNGTEQEPSGLSDGNPEGTEAKPNGKSLHNQNHKPTANYIFGLIRLLEPDHREPDLDAWANDIRLMKERDGRSDEDIRSLFAWANQHHFWKTNILCPSTLRKQWDKLNIQRKNGATHAPRQQLDNSPAARAKRANEERKRAREQQAINGESERVD